ncbi:MAG: hypothetical protein SYC29_03150 [Planctomycetota bacterium]|nr:hypothetical protein [Planctomycetota bacterium]
MLAAIGSLGCQKASQGLSPATGASLTYPAPAEAERGDEANAAGETHPAETAAREELGDEAAEKLKIEPRQPPTPAEPGALALVASMTAAMPDRETDDEGVTRIGIHFLRNQSRAEASEFDAFTKRLAELLSAAGRSLSVSFTTAGDEPVQYELLGAAYLITADGSDQWELFLRLCPAEESWTVWENEVPVRVIRQPRPGQPQITQWPLAQ